MRFFREGNILFAPHFTVFFNLQELSFTLKCIVHKTR